MGLNMNLRKCLLAAWILGCVAQSAWAQKPEPEVSRAENGWFMSPYGRIHILVVYAEMKFDSTYGYLDPVKDPEGTIGWKVGKMPNWKQWVVAMTPEEDCWMTKYFRQASFGKFQVTGDVLDTIMTVPITSVRDARGNIVVQEAFAGNFYKQTLLKQVNGIENPKFLFGSRLTDFDRWTYKGNGLANEEKPDGKIDLICVVWRNIHVVGLGDASGYVSPGDFGAVFGMHTNMYSMFATPSMLPMVIMRHEFSHMLYGGNNFHTANGGVGTRTFISTVGGWSNMSASDACSGTWNAWDRERLQWGNPDNQYVLSTRCADDGVEHNGDMVYGQDLCFAGEYILRDFATTGDAIKIKLPHLPKGVRNQYLWLENHQRLDGIVDHDKVLPKGLYALIQVGKDDRSGKNVFGGFCNYLWPLVGQGNYDFGYDPKTKGLLLDEELANPLTGYTYFVRHMIDLDNDHKLRITADQVPKTEYVFPEKLFVEGKEIPAEFFSFVQYPHFGTKETPFLPDLHPKIGIAYNPAATPIYSHSGTKPLPDDNRRIYLNGLSVEVLEQRADGSLKIRIRWDDFDIPTNVRWCGDIVLREKVIVKRGGSITLDQGYSPQIAEKPQVIDGKDVFAEPTILEVDSGGLLKLEKFGNLWIKRGSTLLVRKGATVELANQAGILVERGAHIMVEKGAILKVGKRESGIHYTASDEKGYSVNGWFAKRVKAE
jgi:M6 family metalloprotease-like protein